MHNIDIWSSGQLAAHSRPKTIVSRLLRQEVHRLYCICETILPLKAGQ